MLQVYERKGLWKQFSTLTLGNGKVENTISFHGHDG